MPRMRRLLEKNRAWSERVRSEDPEFFARLSRQQSPEYLWIGCADSRVPANEIVDLPPGELFVHRNIANLVVHTDLNCLSVMQFAIDVLRVQHVIVCGHYGCSGIRAAMRGDRIGLSDNWLRHVHDVREKHASRMGDLAREEAAGDRLSELNVIEQVLNVCRTTIVRDAWERGQDLAVHGWIYRLDDGLVRDLGTTVRAAPDTLPAYEAALARLA